MIKITDARGRVTYLAESHVVSIRPMPNGMYAIQPVVGDTVEVERESVDRIVRIIEGGAY